jgi:glycine cleavage system aminomethyltransferase T
MGLHDAVRAIRSSVAVSRLDHVRCVRLRGHGAYDALDRVCPADLYVRDGQILHGLLLEEDASLFADIYLACDDEEYLLLAEGPTQPDFVEYLRRHTADVADVEIVDLSEAYSLIGLNGPYAWELMGSVAGEETIGLPYLTFFHQEQWICCRVGKTGEYGYAIIVPAADAPAAYERCLHRGGNLDAVEADLDALDQCALENWFLNVRREGRQPVTPIELQLQWRVSYRKTYVGSDALARRRAEGSRERLTCLVADGAVQVGSDVVLDGRLVGRVVNAGYSPTRGKWVALALIDIAWAYPGIDALRVDGADGAVCARSVSPPVINNRSLYVSPQLHSYRTRDEFDFPPLEGG